MDPSLAAEFEAIPYSEAQLAGAQAMRAAHRSFDMERRELKAQVWKYRALLAEHGIKIDDDPRVEADDIEMFLASRRVVRAAGELLSAMKALEKVYGTSGELLGGEPWSC